jgi:hypothetical protein
MNHSPFVRWSGLALATGGALTLLINAALTPLLPTDLPFPEAAVSTVFLVRQSLSALAAVCLLLGAVGLYLRQGERAGLFSGIAFLAAFLGSATLLAVEWSQVFLVRDFARIAPEALTTLDEAAPPVLYALGPLVAFSLFSLGWLAFAVALLRGGVFARRGPLLVIVGLFAIPILGGVGPGVWGVILGNGILAAGWVLLGLEVRREATP